eukprot:1017076-Prymnesium_polylepis.1
MERTIAPARSKATERRIERLRQWSAQCRHEEFGTTVSMTPPDFCTSPPASDVMPSCTSSSGIGTSSFSTVANSKSPASSCSMSHPYTCNVRIQQSHVEAYFGPRASSIGAKMRFVHSETSGQPSTPSATPKWLPIASPLRRPAPSRLGLGVSKSELMSMYVMPAYSKPAPNCSMARASGDRSQ